MIGLRGGLGPPLSLALLVLSSGAASAGAAVVSGSNLAATPNDFTCIPFMPAEKLSCTATNAMLPASSRAAGGTKAKIDGVIVSWRIKSAGAASAHTIGLRVVHGIEGGGAGPKETLSALAGEYSYAARVPVRAGDEIGIDMFEIEAGTSPLIVREGVAKAQVDFWAPPLTPGGSQAPTALPERELMMNATIEPDADHDGYGDETQDACPTVAGPSACPVPAAPLPRPDTAITKGPSGKIHSRTAVFKFRSDPPGASFECKFDKRKFKRCGSPRKYRHLGLGRHKFQVRAVNATGRDSIPATRAFRIMP